MPHIKITFDIYDPRYRTEPVPQTVKRLISTHFLAMMTNQAIGLLLLTATTNIYPRVTPAAFARLGTLAKGLKRNYSKACP